MSVHTVKARKHYINLPTNYIEELQQKGKRVKSRAFMEYFFDMHQEAINSLRFYGVSWDVSKSTAELWIKDFKHEIDRYFSYWMIQNDTHYSNVKNKVGQKLDTTKNTIGHDKDTPSTTISDILSNQLDTTKNTIGQEVDKDSNKNLNNINVESKDSPGQSSSKTNYSSKFEILWSLYDLKKSNKKRSFTIYNKRFKDAPLEILKTAIIRAKEDMTIGYEKHFDGFLNGVIDSYIPRRAWIKDAKGITHYGLYHEIDSKFVTPKGTETTIESIKLSKLIEKGYFGYED